MQKFRLLVFCSVVGKPLFAYSKTPFNTEHNGHTTKTSHCHHASGCRADTRNRHANTPGPLRIYVSHRTNERIFRPQRDKGRYFSQLRKYKRFLPKDKNCHRIKKNTYICNLIEKMLFGNVPGFIREIK